MFAIVYRIHIKPGRESEYEKLWRTVADYFIAQRGAIGSCLHKTEEGYYLAYSRWPDKQTRDASWPGDEAPANVLPMNIREAIIAMKDCVDQNNKPAEICMDVIDDRLS